MRKGSVRRVALLILLECILVAFCGLKYKIEIKKSRHFVKYPNFIKKKILLNRFNEILPKAVIMREKSPFNL